MVGPSQSPSPGGPQPNRASYAMRIGLSAGVGVKAIPPPLVFIPGKPSTQAMGVGQCPLTTARAEPTSYLLLVNGTGAPFGKSPSSITSLRTLAAINARPSSALPCPGLELSKPATLV